MNLGEIYKGIELKLKAYGDNVEKLFYVKPGADPEQIKISLSGIQSLKNPPPLSPSLRGRVGCPPLAGAGGGVGARGLSVNEDIAPTFMVGERQGKGARGLSVNEHGELEVETALGTVKFTKPIAYQEIDGKRVAVEYSIQAFRIEGTEGRGAGEQGGRGELETQNAPTLSPSPPTTAQNPSSSTLCWHPRTWAGLVIMRRVNLSPLTQVTQAGTYM